VLRTIGSGEVTEHSLRAKSPAYRALCNARQVHNRRQTPYAVQTKCVSRPTWPTRAAIGLNSRAAIGLNSPGSGTGAGLPRRCLLSTTSQPSGRFEFHLIVSAQFAHKHGGRRHHRLSSCYRREFTLLNWEGRYEPITWPSNAAGSVMFPTRSTFPGRTLHGLEVLLLLNKRLVARALVRQQ
jgi:hypothetical protein